MLIKVLRVDFGYQSRHSSFYGLVEVTHTAYFMEYVHDHTIVRKMF